MNIEKQKYTLEDIPANRKLIENLYCHGKISREAREYALNLLYPHNQWKLWISYLLLCVGSALLLSGIIHFFAFNWSKIIPSMKLFTLEFSIVACLAGVYFTSLQGLAGKVTLLFASIFVGVFLAVFGQIYQTGADSYKLFMMWSLLTFAWTLISHFAAQWIFWLIISNTFLCLWWIQAFLPLKETEFLIFIYMTAFNGLTLALREYLLLKKSYQWLEAQWIRVIMLLTTLIIITIPIIVWILEFKEASESLILSAAIGLLVYAILFFLYRYKLPDIQSFSIIVLFGCIIVETAGFKILYEQIQNNHSIISLLMGLMTIAVFTGALVYLRKIAKNMENKSCLNI